MSSMSRSLGSSCLCSAATFRTSPFTSPAVLESGTSRGKLGMDLWL